MTYNWTDNAMEVGIANCNPDVVDENLMHLKYDNAGGVTKFSNLGTVTTNITLAENIITTAYFSGTNTITLPTITDTANQVVCVLDFTTANEGSPSIVTDGITLKKKEGKSLVYSNVSGTRNVLTFKSIENTTTWEVELEQFGGTWVDWTQPALTSNTSYGTVSASSEYSSEFAAWKAGDVSITTDWITASGPGYWNWLLPVTLKINSIQLYANNVSGGRSGETSVYTSSAKTTQIGLTQTFVNVAQALLTFTPSTPVITNNIFVDIQASAGSQYVGLCKVVINAQVLQV